MTTGKKIEKIKQYYASPINDKGMKQLVLKINEIIDVVNNLPQLENRALDMEEIRPITKSAYDLSEIARLKKKGPPNEGNTTIDDFFASGADF